MDILTPTAVRRAFELTGGTFGETPSSGYSPKTMVLRHGSDRLEELVVLK